MVLREEEEGYLAAVVKFGLPFPREEIDVLADILNDWIPNTLFTSHETQHCLVVERVFHPDTWVKDKNKLREFCDQLYPFITHMRTMRDWNKDLVGLALEPVSRLPRA